MGTILYYSNYCDNCKNLLLYLTKSNLNKQLHFICIDNRIQKNNNTYIILENNQQLLLPNTITCVPALLLINNNYQVIFGDDIITHLKPITQNIIKQTLKNNDEPSCYSIDNRMSGIVSDNFSFLDQNIDELSASGNGGMRQTYSYAPLDFQEKIYTPDEDYAPNKINENSIKEYENNRNNI